MFSFSKHIFHIKNKQLLELIKLTEYGLNFDPDSKVRNDRQNSFDGS